MRQVRKLTEGSAGWVREVREEVVKVRVKVAHLEGRGQADVVRCDGAFNGNSVVWDPHLQNDIEKLERVQRSAARYATNNYTDRTHLTHIDTEAVTDRQAGSGSDRHASRQVGRQAG